MWMPRDGPATVPEPKWNERTRNDYSLAVYKEGRGWRADMTARGKKSSDASARQGSA